MRNKQDITDYKKLWIASYLAMTDNRMILRLLHSTRLPVIARNEAIQKVQLLYVINFSSLYKTALFFPEVSFTLHEIKSLQ
jgi:hypothetical protein